MKLQARTSPARCAYCHDDLVGADDLCACGGTHADCVEEFGACVACGAEVDDAPRLPGIGRVTACEVCGRMFRICDVHPHNEVCDRVACARIFAQRRERLRRDHARNRNEIAAFIALCIFTGAVVSLFLWTHGASPLVAGILGPVLVVVGVLWLALA